MFGDGSLTFREFIMREPLPLATIHDAVLEFLRGRTDAVLFGAHAVNAYVDEPRMTQEVDILSPRALELAEELRAYLSQEFQIAVRVRTVANGLGHRLYQVSKAYRSSPRRCSRSGRLASSPDRRGRHGCAACGIDLPESGRNGQSVRDGKADDRPGRYPTSPFGLPPSEGSRRPRRGASSCLGHAPAPALEAWQEIAAQEIDEVNDEDGY